MYDHTNESQNFTNTQVVPQKSYQNAINHRYDNYEANQHEYNNFYGYNYYTPNNQTYETNKDGNTSFTTQNISHQYNDSFNYCFQDPSSYQNGYHTDSINYKYQQSNDYMMNGEQYYYKDNTVIQNKNTNGFEIEKNQKN